MLRLHFEAFSFLLLFLLILLIQESGICANGEPQLDMVAVGIFLILVTFRTNLGKFRGYLCGNAHSIVKLELILSGFILLTPYSCICVNCCSSVGHMFFLFVGLLEEMGS